MLGRGKARGIQTLLATLPPQRPGGLRAPGAPFVTGLNDRIKMLAAGRGAILVDVYRAFDGDLILIGSDGLHPTEGGSLDDRRRGD